MERSSSKRIKVDSKPICSHQQLLGSNLLDNVTSLGTSSSLKDSKGSDSHLDFEALRWQKIFVDKSMLIRSIMEDEECRILLTAPPRFGKTMACNILKKFFEIVNDEQKLEKYKLFTDLKIYKCTEECPNDHDCESKRFFRQHCGQYPVISLDFAQLSATSYNGLLVSLRNMIRRQFEEYETYLIYQDGETLRWSSNNMGRLDVERFLRYLKYADDDDHWKEAKDHDEAEEYIFTAFEYLMKVLSAHYQTKQTHNKIIILIDEFDAPFMELLFSRRPSDLRIEMIIPLIRKLMRFLCKDQISAEFVQRVVIFSVTALGGMISLGANNVERRTFLDKNDDYYNFFGFTKDEVNALVKSTVREESDREKALVDIACWYNNYTVIGDKDTTICNPVSIRKYLPKLHLGSYWVDSVGIRCVSELFKFEIMQEKVFPAIREDQNISISTTTIQLDDIANLKSLSDAIYNCISQEQVDLALQFLTECGYFNIVEKKDGNWILRIPNYEVRDILTDKLHKALLWVKTGLFDEKRQQPFVNALESLGCGEHREYMQSFKQSVENLYIGREKPKAHFHFHCDLLFLICNAGKFQCFSELPIREGWSPRLDLLIITKNAAIVIEVKRHKQDSAEKGLKQCLEKKYYKAFEFQVNRTKHLNKILMSLHLDDDGKVRIRYLENFEGIDENNIATIVNKSHKC